MTGFTRILHRTVPDILMEEVRHTAKQQQLIQYCISVPLPCYSSIAPKDLCSPAYHHRLHQRPTSAFALHTHPACCTLNV